MLFSKVKILHVIPSIAEADGGTTYAIKLVTSSLVVLGVGVDIATTDDNGNGSRLFCRSCSKRSPSQHGGECKSQLYFPKWTKFYKISPSFAWWIFRHVGDYPIVHIHALFSFVSVVAALAARWRGVPYLVCPHGSLTHYGITQRRPWLKRLSLKYIEGPILRHANAVHFTSEAERDEALTLGIPFNAVVIPLGIDPLEPRPVEPRDRADPTPLGVTRLLYLSRLDPKKNLEGLIQALGLLKMGGRAGQRLQLLIAGDGDSGYVASLKKLADEKGVSEQVHWLGYVGGDPKAELFASADIFVLPSYSENFGIAVVEALSAGLPCVLGKGVAVAGDVVEAAAGIAVEPEPKQIAEAIMRLMDDAGLRREMEVNARQLVSDKFSTEAMGRSLVALYSRILKNSH